MSILGLLTRGYLGTEGTGGGGTDPSIEIALSPEVLVKTLSPLINPEGKDPPDFSVLSVDSIPDPVVAEDLVPGFSIKRIASQVPDAKPQESSDSPSVKIRQLEELIPEIVKKDD